MYSILKSRDEQLQVLEDVADTYFGPVWVVDRDGVILLVNEKAYQKYKLPPESILGTTIYEVMERGILNGSSTAEALQTKRVATCYVENCTDVPVVAMAIPLLDNQGEVRRVVAFSQDVDIPFSLAKKIDEERRAALNTIHYLSQTHTRETVIAESQAMKNILQFLERAAAYDSTIAIYGESGVGKEVVARFIHRNSGRADKPWLPFNCAALPAELTEAELFGYEGGAFTGARREGKAGLFELANNSTLFLDEIGELSLSVQSKLLRVIELGEFRRIGGKKIIHTNVRLITATNRDLEKMVETGEFREDLYYRINTIPVIIPPLRERPEDIEPLIHFFLQNINKRFGTNKYFTKGTIEALKKYEWPGNARELRNIIEQMCVSTNDDAMTFRDSFLLPYILKRTVGKPDTAPAKSLNTLAQQAEDPVEEGTSMRDALKNFEKQYILDALKACNQNVGAAADMLKMHRSALYRKMAEHDISREA